MAPVCYWFSTCVVYRCFYHPLQPLPLCTKCHPAGHWWKSGTAGYQIQGPHRPFRMRTCIVCSVIDLVLLARSAPVMGASFKSALCHITIDGTASGTTGSLWCETHLDPEILFGVCSFLFLLCSNKSAGQAVICLYSPSEFPVNFCSHLLPQMLWPLLDLWLPLELGSLESRLLFAAWWWIVWSLQHCSAVSAVSAVSGVQESPGTPGQLADLRLFLESAPCASPCLKTLHHLKPVCTLYRHLLCVLCVSCDGLYFGVRVILVSENGSMTSYHFCKSWGRIGYDSLTML